MSWESRSTDHMGWQQVALQSSGDGFEAVSCVAADAKNRYKMLAENGRSVSKAHPCEPGPRVERGSGAVQIGKSSTDKEESWHRLAVIYHCGARLPAWWRNFQILKFDTFRLIVLGKG